MRKIIVSAIFSVMFSFVSCGFMQVHEDTKPQARYYVKIEKLGEGKYIWLKKNIIKVTRYSTDKTHEIYFCEKIPGEQPVCQEAQFENAKNLPTSNTEDTSKAIDLNSQQAPKPAAAIVQKTGCYRVCSNFAACFPTAIMVSKLHYCIKRCAKKNERFINCATMAISRKDADRCAAIPEQK